MIQNTNLNPEQISEIVFDGIETKLSTKMSYKQEDSNFIIYAYKDNVIEQEDLNIVNSVCSIHGLLFKLVVTPRGIAFKIYKVLIG